MDNVTSDDIKKALALQSGDDFFITECKNGSTFFPPSQGLLKFDGLQIAKSWTHPKITIYEVKVSRGDFHQDNKWNLYLQYCNEFYFVVPKGLIKKDELPDHIGLQYYNPETGCIRTVKKAQYKKIKFDSDMLMYIIMNRIDNDRLPFYENNKQEYARLYVENKAYKNQLGETLGTKLAQEITELREKVRNYNSIESELNKMKSLIDMLNKHKFFYWSDSFVEDVEATLSGGINKSKLDSINFWLNKLSKSINELGESDNV